MNSCAREFVDADKFKPGVQAVWQLGSENFRSSFEHFLALESLHCPEDDIGAFLHIFVRQGLEHPDFSHAAKALCGVCHLEAGAQTEGTARGGDGASMGSSGAVEGRRRRSGGLAVGRRPGGVRGAWTSPLLAA